ncbi:MAG TPA: hypothetical protein VKH18_14410 [Terriglobales bacterium]|nr:hypothetical protein [Terriglobales bacterium]
MNDAHQSDVLAEEAHTGRAWSLIILLALLGPMIGVALVPSPGGRWAVVLIGVVAIGVFAMSWSGFRYRFLRHGVEIRMLGFRLRSIPKQSIVSYSIEPWNLIRGYGIRGIGSTRAYVWCNQVVHIKTSTGDIFLGHNNPARIVRDLDMVTGLISVPVETGLAPSPHAEN